MWTASHGRQKRRCSSPSTALSPPDTSPFTVGATTSSRSRSTTSRRASSTGTPAAFNGFEASKIRLAASASDHGAVATATAARSARR